LKNPYLNLITAFWRFSDKKHKKKLILAGFMFVVANIVELSKPMILALMLNEIQKGVNEELFSKIFVYLILFALATLVFWLLHWPARVLERTASFEATKNYTNFLYEKVANLPLKRHRDHHSGYTIDRMKKSYEALKYFSGGSYEYIQSTVKLVGSFIIILWIFPYSAIMALTCAVFVFFWTIWFNKQIVNLTKKLNIKSHEMMSSFFDYVSNISTVLTLNLQKLTQQEFLYRIKKMKDDFVKRAKINEWKWFSVSMVVEILVFLILLGFLFFELKSWEVILIGTIVALFQYTDRFVSTFFNFTYTYEKLILQNTNFKIADSILEDSEKYEEKNILKDFPKQLKNIKISNLYFTYSDDKKITHHLKNISLNIEKWKHIAFVGESWSWKSTLMTLIRGLESPDEFKFLLNGQKQEFFPILSKYSTLIPQEPEIFENTILFNISFWISNSEKDVMKAVEMANFSEVLKRLPDWLNSNIKEKGVNLSWWEKQRLALARWIFAALREKSQIVLLDEPTSSVDPKNDAEIYENILEHFKDSSVISSLHKLHLCQKFDTIYVFKNWEIVEVGDFDELIKKEGEFYKLWEKQE